MTSEQHLIESLSNIEYLIYNISVVSIKVNAS